MRTPAQVRGAVGRAAEREALVVHTLVTDELRRAVIEEGRLRNVPTIDLMGPLLDRLSHHLAVSPSEKPGLFRQLNETYFRRIESMEYAFHHDDGQRAHELHLAEIVLVGVSRTFKTPLSIYLATKGWFVANVPIVLGLEPPPELWKLPPRRVVGLMTRPLRLANLRRARQEYLNQATGDYADPAHVRRELDYARFICQKDPAWPVVEVTGKPVEEIAAEIVTLVGREERGEEGDGENG